MRKHQLPHPAIPHVDFLQNGPAGVNKEIVKNGVHGFLANTQEEWIEKLEILINDPVRRERMGMEGRKRVIEHYSLEANAPRMLKIFQQLSSSAN